GQSVEAPTPSPPLDPGTPVSDHSHPCRVEVTCVCVCLLVTSRTGPASSQVICFHHGDVCVCVSTGNISDRSSFQSSDMFPPW
ncbi:hypothetical protein RRG08_066561, partial [Elysia crispata]